MKSSVRIVLAGVIGMHFFLACPHNEVTISTKTYHIVQRFYFINRLIKTIELLTKLEATTLIPHRSEMQVLFPHFEHRLVRESVREIIATGSLKPLFMVWEHFATYHSIEDDMFVEEFSQELFIVTRAALAQPPLSRTDESPIPLPASVEEVCDALDELVASATLPEEETTSLETHAKHHKDFTTNASPDEVARRFYYIHRLYRALQLCVAHAYHDELALQVLQKSWDDVLHYKHIHTDEHVAVVCHLVLTLLTRKYTKHQPLDETASIDTMLTMIDEASDNLEEDGVQSTSSFSWWWFCPLYWFSLVQACIASQRSSLIRANVSSNVSFVALAE